MSRRHILIGFPLGVEATTSGGDLRPDLIAKLHAIDSSVDVVYAPVHDPELLQAMRSGSYASDGFASRFPQAYLEALPTCEIILTLLAPTDLLHRAPALRWLANAGSGTEQHMALGLSGSLVTLTCAKGVAADSIAEFAMSQLLVLARGWPTRLQHQQQKLWKLAPCRNLKGLTLGLIGLGEIGSRCAHLAHAFGMRVVAMRRRSDAPPTPGVDLLASSGDLPAFLGQCDAVVVAAPLTRETAGMFDRAAFSYMRHDAWLVNVARGGIVDEAALCDALHSGHLAGAAIDVFAKEPLPSDSPLWSAPNLLISAHEAVNVEVYGLAVFDNFVLSFARYRRNEPLPGIVNTAAGY